MIELGVSQGPPVVKHSYTALITELAEAQAAGLLHVGLAAVETAANLYSRAFCSAEVEPRDARTRALSPMILGTVGRRLVEQGEVVFLLDVEGGAVTMTEASSVNVTGSPEPSSWRYQITRPGPSTTTTGWYPRDQVAHVVYATRPEQPWAGVAPLRLAGESGRLARALERHVGDEVAGPVGQLLAIPQDAGGEVDPGGEEPEDDPHAGLKRQIAGLRGRAALLETTAQGWDDGKSSAPKRDWVPSRLGASPPVALVQLREQIERCLLSVLGVPVAMLGQGDGSAAREGYRRFVFGSVEPLARIVEAEMSRALDTEVSLSFRGLHAADIASRSRAWRSLVGRDAAMDDGAARRLVGLG